MRRKVLSLWLFISLVALAVIYASAPASATGNGIPGVSGKNGSTCTSCHSTGTPPTVTLSGPTTVSSGSSNSYTITVGSSGNHGIDVASSGGNFTAGTGTRIANGELVHSSPSSAGSWTFMWMAPTVTSNTNVTIWAAGTNGFGGGTGTGVLQQTITVTAPQPAATLAASPSSLAFAFTGGAIPVPQGLSISSSGSALSYTVATSGGSWLTATPASSSTPGNVSVSVNPSGLAAGAHTGSVTISSASSSNGPVTVPVTLNVTAAPPTNPSLTLNPPSLNFAFTTGGTNPASQKFSVSNSGSQINYTVGTSASWLSATGNSTTPGTVTVSVNPAGLSAGTYNGNVSVTSAGAANNPQSVAVRLTVTSGPAPPPPPTTGSGSLTVSTARLVFYAQNSQDSMSPKSITVGSTGSALSYTTGAYGGSWLSVSPSGGSTPGKVSVSAFATGLPAGTYSCVVQIKGGNSTKNVEVVLVVSAGRSGGGGEAGDDGEASAARPFTFDPGVQNTVTASWQSGAGALRSRGDTANQGLVLNKKRSAPANAMAGVVVNGAAGSQLTQLSFDIRSDSECTPKAPQFVVITDDNVTHVAGCANGTARRLTTAGWKRMHFNPLNSSQLTPAVEPGSTVKTLALVMDQTAGNGMAVLDNINLNGKYIGKH